MPSKAASARLLRRNLPQQGRPVPVEGVDETKLIQCALRDRERACERAGERESERENLHERGLLTSATMYTRSEYRAMA